MPVLSEEEKSALRVENFIFHAVHHGEVEPTLHDAVPLGPFEEFFVKRVLDTVKGNRFVFTPGSSTMTALRGIEEDPGSFVETSKRLARQFHRADDRDRHDGRFKRGILMVTSLSSGTRRFHSLIKLDHFERVLDIVDQDAGATLAEVRNPVSENKKALQKSALIELDGEGGNLVVIDHGKRSGITDFFQGFLGVARAREASELTAAVAKTVLKTVQAHAGELPPEMATQWRQRLADVAVRRLECDTDQVFADLFGAGGSEAVRATWDAQLEAHGVAGEGFLFDHAKLPAGGPKKYRTAENIEINVPPGALDTFSWDPQPDGSIVITIRTGTLTER